MLRIFSCEIRNCMVKYAGTGIRGLHQLYKTLPPPYFHENWHIDLVSWLNSISVLYRSGHTQSQNSALLLPLSLCLAIQCLMLVLRIWVLIARWSRKIFKSNHFSLNGTQGAGFESLMTRFIHWPNMAIFVRPIWSFTFCPPPQPRIL